MSLNMGSPNVKCNSFAHIHKYNGTFMLMYIPCNALYYHAMGLWNWFHSKWLIKTPAVTQHSLALDFQFCCRSRFPFAYVFAGKTNYQMAHGYFYILYGGLPADNYDITGRLLCFALRSFGRGHQKLFHLTVHLLTGVYLSIICR